MVRGKEIFRIIAKDPKLQLFIYKYNNEFLSAIREYKDVNFKTFKEFASELNKMVKKYFPQNNDIITNKLFVTYIRETIYPLFEQGK